jgi:uncharacterized NAD-dependent epimerase/dehydratase family protein
MPLKPDTLRIATREDLQFPGPYLLFLGAATSVSDAKTALGLVEWRRQACLGQWRLPGCGVDLGLPDLDAAQAFAQGARSVIVGVAPEGGRLDPAWREPLTQALRSGLHVVSGMHDRLSDDESLQALATRHGVRLLDVRHLPAGLRLPVGNGRPRSGLRLLTVGTDCAIGKKYSALALERALRRRGVAADFRATGQTGIMISGGGLAVDAVVADFIAGAVEVLAPAAAPGHWDLVEGQGSLFHPAYAGVSLGLLHGAQPHALVLCHDTRRPHLEDHPDYPMPEVRACIELNLGLARRTNPHAEFVGVCLNTAGMSEAARDEALAGMQALTGLPTTDPIARGVEPIVDRLLERFPPGWGG